MEDPWDVALEAITAGQFPALPAASPEEPLFATYVRALWSSAQNLHPQALSHYLRLTEFCPERADFRTFAGFHAFQLGQLDMAEQLWLESLQFDAQQPTAFAFLGYLATHRQDWQAAADFFGAAAQLEPDQPLHLQRRQQALQQLP
jgi:Flp pilus assembly protein TadD